MIIIPFTTSNMLTMLNCNYFHLSLYVKKIIM